MRKTRGLSFEEYKSDKKMISARVQSSVGMVRGRGLRFGLKRVTNYKLQLIISPFFMSLAVLSLLISYNNSNMKKNIFRE